MNDFESAITFLVLVQTILLVVLMVGLAVFFVEAKKLMKQLSHVLENAERLSDDLEATTNAAVTRLAMVASKFGFDSLRKSLNARRRVAEDE